MPLKLALAVRETVAGHRLGALEGGAGATFLAPPALPMHPWCQGPEVGGLFGQQGPAGTTPTALDKGRGLPQPRKEIPPPTHAPTTALLPCQTQCHKCRSLWDIPPALQESLRAPGGGAIKAEGVCRWVFPGERTWSPFEAGILRVRKGGWRALGAHQLCWG